MPAYLQLGHESWSLLDDGDIRDAVILREVVRGRQTVPATADDDRVIAFLELRRPPKHPRFVVLVAEGEFEKPVRHSVNLLNFS